MGPEVDLPEVNLPEVNLPEVNLSVRRIWCGRGLGRARRGPAIGHGLSFCAFSESLRMSPPKEKG